MHVMQHVQQRTHPITINITAHFLNFDSQGGS